METFPLARNQVRDKDRFENLLLLYDCRIVDTDQYYYYIEGESENLEELFISIMLKTKD